MIEIFNSFELWVQSYYSSLSWLQLTDIAVHLFILPLLILKGFYIRLYEWRSFNRYVASGISSDSAKRRARNAFRSGEKRTLGARLFDRLFLYLMKRTTN